MANPFSLLGLTEFEKGPGKATDNFTSLGDGEAKIIGYIDLSSSAPKADVVLAPITIKTGATGWVAGDQCSLKLLVAEETGQFTDGILHTVNTDISASLIEAITLDTIDTEVVSTEYVFDRISIAAELENGSRIPRHIAIVLHNEAAAVGADLSATAGDHYARYDVVSWV